MEQEIVKFSTIMKKTWHNFLEIMPALLVSLAVVLIGIFIIKTLNNYTTKLIGKYSKNPLITDFLANIVSFILHVLVIIIALSILGWGSITNKILAGAGITTFIIGFALKDIGENFLAGILMAFRRPFKVGDLIEVDKVHGRVMKMTLRETMVKTLDGKDVFVPNGMILKNPLYNYTSDNHLRGQFMIALDYQDNIAEAIDLIYDTVNSFRQVDDLPAPQVVIQDLVGGSANVRVQFWYETDNVHAPAAKLRSDIMLKVIQVLSQKGYSMPSDTLEIKMPNTNILTD